MWNDLEKAEIEALLSSLVESQAYASQKNLEAVMKVWEMTLGQTYKAGQVEQACMEFVMQSDQFPTPADIVKILSPETSKVTESMYISANDTIRRKEQRWMKQGFWDGGEFNEEYQAAKAVKLKFEAQQGFGEGAREQFKIKDEKTKAFLSDFSKNFVVDAGVAPKNN